MAILKKYIVPLVLAMAIIWVVFVSALQLIVFNTAYFQWHYEAHNVSVTTEMAVEDLMVVTIHMLDYLKDKETTLDMEGIINGKIEEVFGQREKDHMVDVKALYIGARSLQWAGTVLIVLLLTIAFKRPTKKFFGHLLNGILYGIPVLLVGVVGLGVLFATDFDKYFTKFHEIFFSNDLWLLDPKTDILINMVPEVYFYSVVMITLILFLVMIAMVMMLSFWMKRKLKSI